MEMKFNYAFGDLPECIQRTFRRTGITSNQLEIGMRPEEEWLSFNKVLVDNRGNRVEHRHWYVKAFTNLSRHQLRILLRNPLLRGIESHKEDYSFWIEFKEKKECQDD